MNGTKNCPILQQPKKSYKFKLIYFEDRGAADLVKLLFAYAEFAYEDVQIKQSEWNSYKSFMPFEQLPVLVINDEIRIAPTNTICRFLASCFSLNGNNEIELITCDMISEQLKECSDYAVRCLQETDSTKKNLLANKFINDVLPKTLNAYEKMLSLNSGRFIVGNRLTWADLAIVNAWEWLDDMSKQILNRYPLIKSHNEFVRSLPNVAEWFKIQKPLRVLKYA